MKYWILPEEGGAFKANLHCHSTVSDGRLTVAEIKDYYMKHGYSVIAFTDHDVLVPHPELNEEGKFLALNGYEVEVNEASNPRPFGSAKTCHLCFIAKEPDNLTQVCYHKDRYIWGNARAFIPDLKYDRDDYERVFSHEGVCDMIRRGREGGFFVTYNHPAWSMEDYSDYSGYEGMNAMEIFNSGCVLGGWDDYNSRVYDDLLRQGKRIFCIAADDNHDGAPLGSPSNDSCVGWVVIRAEKLEYRAITAALEAGSFYASTGPEIRALWVEGDTVHVKTSPAHRIAFITGSRHAGAANAHYGEWLEEASFRFNRAADGYVRVDVFDDYGRRANSNAIWLDAYPAE